MTERIQERTESLRLFTTGPLSAPFVPWGGGEQGQQAYIKLARDDGTAYLYAGMGGILDVEIQKALMRLLNDGWALQGELFVTFDGTAEPGLEGLPAVEACTLEMGSGLLPLVDPLLNAPLLDRLRTLRSDIAADIGFVAPGVKVRDNMHLAPSAYRILLQGAPAARGDLFLDRFLAVGSLDQLGSLQGWSTTDPTYRLPAKWIEPNQRELAEQAGCMLFGALSVLLTHLREVIRTHAAELLGLQEPYALVARLRQTHPVVVEEFHGRIDRLRRVRHVLRKLLSESVSIGNMVAILETMGDHLDELDDAEAMAERVRRVLARQIVARYVDDEGMIRALVLADETEARLGSAAEDLDGFVKAVREALDEHQHPPVLFTPPALRRLVRRAVEPSMPGLAVLSTAEIPTSARVQVAGPVHWKAAANGRGEPAEAAVRETPPSGFWKTTKRKKAE